MLKSSLGDMENLFSKALACHQQGDFAKACAMYEQILKVDPRNFQVIGFLAVAFAQSGRLELACNYFERALQLNSLDPVTLNNYANVLQLAGRFEQALGLYDQALLLQPAYVDAYYNRGTALLQLRLWKKALLSFDQALDLQGNLAKSHYNRAIALKELGEVALAWGAYQRALQHDPELAVARWGLAMLSCHPLLSMSDISSIKTEQFSAQLSTLEVWFKSRQLTNVDEVVGSSHPFYLAYETSNHRTVLSSYGDLCRRLMGDWQGRHQLSPNAFLEVGKVQLGIVVCNQRQNYSVWNAITKGMIEALDRSQFDIHVYDLSLQELDPQIALIQNSVKAVTFYKSSVLEWAQSILKADIEVLVYPELGMSGIATALASMRLAPLQIAAWGHPETTGLPTMDWYISAEAFEPTNEAQLSYRERLVALPNLGVFYTPLEIDATLIDLEDLGITRNKPILLCPGAPFKYLPQYDEVLVKIAEQLGECQFIFFIQDSSWCEILRKRFGQCFSAANLVMEDFVVFVPWLEPKRFYGLMGMAQAFLDPIGFSGFNTAMQAVECGLPIVTLPGEFMRSRLAFGILQQMKILELIVNNVEEYISQVVRLVKDRSYQEKMREKIICGRNALYADAKPIRVLENLLLASCRT